ncbi:MAG: nuclear transport factor 2 family protein [Cyclobacteriaceae bacterium]|nr:nuclear transport factor 2 family protein [Cyclobacteriaceae bacterium]
MKTLKATFVLALFLMLTPIISNAQEMSVTLEFKNAATALEVIQKHSKAIEAGDVAALTAQFAPNAMIYGLVGALDSLTVAQHAEFYTNSFNQYKHRISQDLYLPVKVTNNWNEGEWILSWGINTVTDKASGETITIPYHTASMVSNGKITMVRYWYDILNILQNQGYVIKPPSN